MSQNDIYLLSLLLIYRMIGVGLFLVTEEEKMLFFIALLLAVIYEFPELEKYRIPLIVLVFIIKIAQEYYMHFRDNKKVEVGKEKC